MFPTRGPTLNPTFLMFPTRGPTLNPTFLMFLTRGPTLNPTPCPTLTLQAFAAATATVPWISAAS